MSKFITDRYVCPPWLQFLTPKNNKMSIVAPFVFNEIKMQIVTINGKDWCRAKEVCKALEYRENCKTAIIIRSHCDVENLAHKWQLTGVHAACTPLNWPKDSRKYDLYLNEEGMYELLFTSQQAKAKKYFTTNPQRSLFSSRQCPSSLTPIAPFFNRTIPVNAKHALLKLFKRNNVRILSQIWILFTHKVSNARVVMTTFAAPPCISLEAVYCCDKIHKWS